MPRFKVPTKDETRRMRSELAEKARNGTLALPAAVKEMRRALGQSQADFAKMFKLTTRQIAEIERGKANPTSKTLDKIGRAFGFQLGFIKKTQASAWTTPQTEASSTGPKEAVLDAKETS